MSSFLEKAKAANGGASRRAAGISPVNPKANVTVNPFLKKKAVAPKKETPAEEVIEVASAEVVEEQIIETETTPQEVVTVETENAKETINPVEEEPKEEPKEEKASIETKAPEEEKKETPIAEKPVSNKKSKKKETVSVPKQEIEIDYYRIPTTSMSFAEAVNSIKSPFVDENWNEFKEQVIEDINSIEISSDLNAGTLKVLISELSIVREKLWYPLQEAKTHFENFSSKEPEGIIERVKKANAGQGSNDAERKRSGVLACMNYETPNGNINLFEIMDEARERYNFLRSAMDSIKFKTDILITMNGALKLEKEHL